MGKGSKQRPRYISYEEFVDNWNRTFNGRAKGKDQSKSEGSNATVSAKQTRADESDSHERSER